MNKQRFPLRPNIARSEVNDLAWKLNWIFDDLIQATDSSPYEKIWFTDDDQETTAHYIEDGLINIPYLVVKGDDIKNPSNDILESNLVYTRENILSMAKAASSDDELIYSAYCLGVAAPQEYDAEYDELFQALLKHPDPEIRKVAIFAMTYPGWKFFSKALTHLRDNDSEVSVREMARDTLSAFVQNRWAEVGDT